MPPNGGHIAHYLHHTITAPEREAERGVSSMLQLLVLMILSILVWGGGESCPTQGKPLVWGAGDGPCTLPTTPGPLHSFCRWVCPQGTGGTVTSGDPAPRRRPTLSTIPAASAAASFKLPLVPRKMLLSDIFTSVGDTFKTHLSFAHREKWISYLGFDFFRRPTKKKSCKPAFWMPLLWLLSLLALRTTHICH